MIEKLKENTKLKLISLLSSLVLWMYVMAVVDPQERKVFENIPVTINNLDEIEANNFVIYPKTDLEADIYITGKLSILKNVTKDDIRVYGTINDPKEGNNAIYLNADISKGVTYQFKPDTLIISLEKIVEERRSIDVSIDGKYKDNLDTLQLEEDSLKISGPRSLVQQVQKLQATLHLDNKKDIFSTSLKLTPVDENGKKVEGITLESVSVDALVTLLTEKEVPIKAIFDSENSEDIKYKLNKSAIVIKGKKDIIDTIEYINTQPIDLSKLKSDKTEEVKLDIPNGVEIDDALKITIQLDQLQVLTSTFNFTKDDLEIRNSTSEDIQSLNIPENIEVNVEYGSDITNLEKSDIKLYIDLSEDKDSYPIKYESKYEFKSIIINPTNITI